jgi:FKBP-type peptidyl-prolyl cis-trans isomerase
MADGGGRSPRQVIQPRFTRGGECLSPASDPECGLLSRTPKFDAHRLSHITNFAEGGGAAVKQTWIAMLVTVLFAIELSAQEKPELKTVKDMESYAMGVEMQRNLQRQGFEFDLNLVIKGMKDAQAGGKLAMTEEQILESLNIAASQARVKKTGDKLSSGLDNKQREQDFLAANKQKEGIVALPSGLQYKVIQQGAGKKPAAADTVEVQYRGTLLDGTQFESTYGTGRPATIKLADIHVIAGLKEALKLMPVGAKWQLFIPSRLAYGQRGTGKLIGPYAMLTYELEMVGIKQP